MKRFSFSICLIIALLTGLLQPLPATAKGPSFKKKESEPVHRISGGARWHANYPGFEDFPVEQGDLSYALMYEYHEPQAFWQLGATYSPSSSDDRYDYVLTPQLNLIFKDRIFRLGGGVLASKVKTSVDSDWTKIFWQVCFGIEIPVTNSIGIDLSGHYVFESWGSVFESDKSGLEYSAMLSIGF